MTSPPPEPHPTSPEPHPTRPEPHPTRPEPVEGHHRHHVGTLTIGDLTTLLDAVYPPQTAEEWDRVGLVVGDPADEVSCVLLSVDVTSDVVEQARQVGADLIIAHHPLLLRGVTTLRRDEPKGALVAALISSGIGLFTAHTNADIAEHGTAAALADALGLQQIRPLRPVPVRRLDKLVCFAPEADAQRLTDALADAGAGAIDDYDRCAYTTAGIGTFRPLAGAEPFIGTIGEVERVGETRIEMIMERRLRSRVETALLATHPYQTPAYDITELQPVAADLRTGLGRIGTVEPTTLDAFARLVATVLPASGGGIRVAGDGTRPVRTVAVQAGAGDDLLTTAAEAGADVYLTSDLRHHPASEALEAAGRDSVPPALIDVPHWAAEWLWLPELQKLINAAHPVEVIISELPTDPWRTSIVSS